MRIRVLLQPERELSVPINHQHYQVLQFMEFPRDSRDAARLLYKQRHHRN